MYSVYLDGNLVNDPVIGIEDFTLTLERTFDSDNIFREFSESTLTFTGDGYNYLCAQLKNDYCAKVDLQVDIYGETIFEGQIVVSFGTVNFTKRTFETQIVDTSYRGLIRERVKNEISLNSILTVGCEPLTAIPIITLPMYDVNKAFVANVQCYKVYDVFKYLIDAISDNQVALQSNALQNIPYVITTGWNLSSTGNGLPYKLFPEVSFEKLFKNFRSLLTLYASLEIIGGVPTIIIEQESYFFENNPSGYQIADLPYDLNLSVDESRIYSIVEIGSEDYDENDTDYNALNNLKVYGWGKRTLNTCGCVFDKDNTEDLTVDWVIDSGRIMKVLDSNEGSDDIYIIQLDVSNPAEPFMLQDNVTNKWFYNSSLRNEIVALLWSTQFNNCVYTTRTSDNSFRTIANPPPPPYPPPLPADLQFLIAGPCTDVPFNSAIWMYYPQLQYDVYNGVATQNNNLPCAGGVLPKHTTYEAQNFGIYAFTASREISTLYATPLPGESIRFILTIGIIVYSDNTFSTPIHTSVTTDDFIVSNTVFPTGFAKTLTVNTPILNLQPANIARVYFNVQTIQQTGAYNGNINTLFAGGLFESNDDLLACADLDVEGNRIPYLMKFDHPMCKADYDFINANRRQYLEVGGYKGWVKRLDYNPKGIGTFELLTEEIPCCDE